MKAILIIPILTTSLLRLAGEVDPLLEGPGLSIELISENHSVTPGQPFTVGVHIHHFPGFHTYWKNPGNVGVATSIDWTLPKGFTASEISWPYPEKTFMSKYPCHGYERDVTLLVTITPPDKLTEANAKFTAKTTWMCCAKGCFPGFQNFEMTLPVTKAPVPNPTAIAHFNKARSEFPQTSPKLKATLLSKVDAKIIKARFINSEKQTQDNLYFFSTDRQVSSDQKQTFTHHKDGSFELSVPRSEFSPEGKVTLPGVLMLGNRHLLVDIKPAKKFQ